VRVTVVAAVRAAVGAARLVAVNTVVVVGDTMAVAVACGAGVFVAAVEAALEAA
jgi:hypothetical protein